MADADGLVLPDRIETHPLAHKTVVRVQPIDHLDQAQHFDKAAQEKLAKLEQDIADLVAALDAGGKVVFGATVLLVDEKTGDEVTYQIVGEDEADLKQGLIIAVGSKSSWHRWV